MLKIIPIRFLVKLSVMFAFSCVFAVSCFGNPAVQTNEPAQVVETGPTFTPSQKAASLCERPYYDSSIWNVPIDWSMAEIHPQSELMMSAFFEDNDWIGSDTTAFAQNIYYVTSATPLVLVQLRENSYRDAINDIDIIYGEPGGTVWVPLPVDARPAPGTDAQLVVVNLESGEEWGMIYGAIDSLGNWSAGAVYRYHIRNSGIPPAGFAQRGAAIGQLAGVIRPCEVDRGLINHAVTLAYDYPCSPHVCAGNGWPASIPPFTTTDGEGTSQFDIPEGARIVIRPEISEEAISLACQNIRGCIVWALAMQKYGGFIVDMGGHPKTYAEGDATAHWDPEVWSSEMLSNIPKEWYAVLDWNTPFAIVLPK